MNDKLENKLSMYLSVEKVMTDNETKWAGVPKMVLTVNTFRGRLASIASLREIQEENLRGITIDKEARKITMANLALKVAGAIIAYADDTGNNELKENIGFSLTDLIKPRDTTSISRCREIYNKAVPLATLLVEYGIRDTDISELRGAISAYELIIEKPRTAKAMAKAAGTEMVSVFRLTDSLLKNKMDKLMLQYKDTDSAGAAGTSTTPAASGSTGASPSPAPASEADFYMQYINAREIIDLGRRSELEKTFIIPKGAKLTINNVASGKKAVNVGKATLALWEGTGSLQPDSAEIEPGGEWLVNAPSGVLSILNLSSTKEGRCRLRVTS